MSDKQSRHHPLKTDLLQAASSRVAAERGAKVRADCAVSTNPRSGTRLKAPERKHFSKAGLASTVSAISNVYLTCKESARYLRVSKSYLDKLRCTGGGPPYTRLGRKILYRISDLEFWLHQHRFENTSQYDLGSK
jgi:excisionase family DNA binding protein